MSWKEDILWLFASGAVFALVGYVTGWPSNAWLWWASAWVMSGTYNRRRVREDARKRKREELAPSARRFTYG